MPSGRRHLRLPPPGAPHRVRGLPGAGGRHQFPQAGLGLLHEGRLGAAKGLEDVPEDLHADQGHVHEGGRAQG